MVGPKTQFRKDWDTIFLKKKLYGPTKGHFCQILKNSSENNKSQKPIGFGNEWITPKYGELEVIKAKN